MALTTALAWACAVILFKKSGETVHPIALNLFKCSLAAVFMIPTIPIFGGTLLRDAPASEYGVLLLSGLLGIGIADTLFFKCLNSLGAGLSAIIDCLYSPFIIILSVIWLDERMSVLQIVGTFMILSAVLTAISKKGNGHISRKDLWLGIFYGASAMAANAVGIVMVKPLLTRSPLLWVSEVRFFGGILFLVAVLLLHKRRQQIIKTVTTATGWKYTFWGSFIGSYIALVLWLGGMKFTQASIAAVLNQTSSVFIFILAAVFLREPINWQRGLGIALGVGGAIIITFG